MQKPTDKLKREPQVLDVVRYPNDLLLKVSAPVMSSIPHDQELLDFLDDLVATMKHYNGIGLSAVQVGVLINAFVVQNPATGEVLKIINPVIKEEEGNDYSQEGCLSIPGLFTRILRSKEIVLQYFNELGELKTTVFDGILARAIQHEADHLRGIVFFDQMNSVQRDSMLKKYKKVKKVLSRLGA